MLVNTKLIYVYTYTYKHTCVYELGLRALVEFRQANQICVT
jgi:hypothetical protein